MRTPPEGLDETEVIRSLAAAWDLRVDTLRYVPEGRGQSPLACARRARRDAFRHGRRPRRQAVARRLPGNRVRRAAPRVRHRHGVALRGGSRLRGCATTDHAPRQRRSPRPAVFDRDALLLYRLRWSLDDIASFVSVLRAPHTATNDTAHDLRNLGVALEVAETLAALVRVAMTSKEIG